MKPFYVFVFFSTFIFQQDALAQSDKQKAIIKQSLDSCAYGYNYNLSMSSWQQCINEGLKQDSTIAYLWQQKAMPMFKAGKYEVGMKYVDKAVHYDAKRWQPYRAFIKCIFQKSYAAAIADFEDCIGKYGDQYVMEHSFSFFIGLSYLQLVEYEKAEKYLYTYIQQSEEKWGKNKAHHTATFYYAIAKMELGKYEEALQWFEKTLAVYPNFSDAKYYTFVTLYRMGREDYNKWYEAGKKDAEQGYTINDDNVIYERYPYQVRW